eukprot:TRINITY_DN21282_c0_g1_i1.p1 TRINITY_DN21282_c0_g1~~TRINITY_DN21282_c0_g1_i1.p1  ORF type:complete len:361 (+),score=36.14 TRINITY_DN21282_c0_g1_i1:66-1148(+)
MRWCFCMSSLWLWGHLVISSASRREAECEAASQLGEGAQSVSVTDTGREHLLMQLKRTDVVARGSGSCCSRCLRGVRSFCDPQTLKCYVRQAKSHYTRCPQGGDVEPSVPMARSIEGSIKFMSYNIQAAMTFFRKRRRSVNVLKKIRSWKPHVLGAQEVDTGDWRDYVTVSHRIEQYTGLKDSGGSQFSNARDLEKLESDEKLPIMTGSWMSFAKYRQKVTGFTFLLFNFHWARGSGEKQAKIVARYIKELRETHGMLPTILVGDTNQYCWARSSPGVKYLLGEANEAPPVVFVDAIEQDAEGSYSDVQHPDCRVDFIFASKGHWSRVKSALDRGGMGQRGSASHHAALTAELVPLQRAY